MRTAEQLREELLSRRAVVDRRLDEWRGATRSGRVLISRFAELLDQDASSDPELVTLVQQLVTVVSQRRGASRAITAQDLEIRRLEAELTTTGETV